MLHVDNLCQKFIDSLLYDLKSDLVNFPKFTDPKDPWFFSFYNLCDHRYIEWYNTLVSNGADR